MSYCPRDIRHGPHPKPARFCHVCGKELTNENLKRASKIATWAGWPDDVRELLRAWNRRRALRFVGENYWGCAPNVFKCSRCESLCEAHSNGVAVLNDERLCDDCLIQTARAAA